MWLHSPTTLPVGHRQSRRLSVNCATNGRNSKSDSTLASPRPGSRHHTRHTNQQDLTQMSTSQWLCLVCVSLQATIWSRLWWSWRYRVLCWCLSLCRTECFSEGVSYRNDPSHSPQLWPLPYPLWSASLDVSKLSERYVQSTLFYSKFANGN